MPIAVWIIGAAIFAQGTSELMLAGLLPELSTDLAVTTPQAGLLISGFALGMLVGAPVLAIVTLRWPRRRALLVFMAAFVIAHVVGALTTSYAVLFATRFLGAFVYAGFWAVGGSTAMSLVPANRRATAMSIVAGGLTVATVIGLPLGAWIGQSFGWRGAFWAVALMTALAAAAVAAAVPESRLGETPDVRAELRALATPRLGLSYAMTATSTAALLGTFSYLGAMLIDTTGLPAGWVPAVLLTYGVGSLLGITIGGRTADLRPTAVLATGFAGLLVVSVVLALLTTHVVPVVVLVFLLGLFGFGANPALNSRVVTLAPDAPTLAVAGSTSAFNVGIAAGPWLGGVALTAGLGYPAVAWVGAGFAAVALGLLALDTVLARTAQPSTVAGATRRVPRLAGRRS